MLKDIDCFDIPRLLFAIVLTLYFLVLESNGCLLWKGQTIEKTSSIVGTTFNADIGEQHQFTKTYQTRENRLVVVDFPSISAGDSS
jgi:hypothetical protein